MRSIPYSRIVGIWAGLFLFLVALPPGWATAQPRYRPVHAGYGKVVKVLPAGYRVVTVGGVAYHYHHGVFYRPRGKRWVVVRPPMGAVVAVPPAAAVKVTVAGVPHYLSGGVYYRKVPAGYRVVKAPVATVATPVPGDRVQVTVRLLNVRSGPGKGHDVIRKVAEGKPLTVRGNAPGWLFVELGDGGTGWVMDAYTAHVAAPARG